MDIPNTNCYYLLVIYFLGYSIHSMVVSAPAGNSTLIHCAVVIMRSAYLPRIDKVSGDIQLILVIEAPAAETVYGDGAGVHSAVAHG
mmetsp:Transcript_10860/g.9301  ORF Transcript_10860/g.9301 Transcript_10860/m.9301 type:complete len:87 (+) Transcript_10860:259-519(+)